MKLSILYETSINHPRYGPTIFRDYKRRINKAKTHPMLLPRAFEDAKTKAENRKKIELQRLARASVGVPSFINGQSRANR
ncbi:hypothetical protein CEXT_205961 [Caerostris extrusa]|uniref:Uncharacterized protein n=1 Tax=Caerostris extrusa TaxID=172846 RepID=A0AAV4TSP5_CAEEX|nr:hypothetical protein CEXT_205961 [Caerostris extrusa]